MASMEPLISSFMRLFLLSAFLVVCLVIKVSGNIEGDALNALKNSMSDPTNVLQSWDATIVTPCTWFRVTCNSENSVIRVDLGNANLSGELVSQLGQLQNLQYLELYSNNITGKIPDEIGNLTNLVGLDLYFNKITGSIPDNLANLKKLRFLRLNNNNLSGKIPMRLTTVTTLQMLDLSYNNLEGDVPVNGSFSFFTLTSFKGNPFLNQAAPTLSTPTRQQNPSGNDNRAIGAIEAITGGIIVMGVALLFAAPLIAIIYEKRRKLQDFFFDVAAEEDPEVHLGQLRRFSLRELQFATDNFNNKNFLGEGASGKVYKGRLMSAELVAVKRLVAGKRINEELTQGWQMQFLTEVEMISVAVHRNLLRLRGFCITPTERILVYPYMVNGSVASNLRDRSESQPPLDWHKRKRIALVAARVLAYLHDHCDPKVIHRDVKATNILLDEEFEAFVGDFGLAKLMSYEDTDVTSLVRGTIGHIPPEYLSTGKTSEKTDTYGYGMMLFELITGQGASGLARLADDDNLMFLDWVKVLIKEQRMMVLVDADLNENYDEREVEDVIQLALLCTQDSPWERPKMSEVVRMLEGDGLAEKWDQWWHKEDMIQQNFTPTYLQATSWPFPFDSPSTSNISTRTEILNKGNQPRVNAKQWVLSLFLAFCQRLHLPLKKESTSDQTLQNSDIPCLM